MLRKVGVLLAAAVAVMAVVAAAANAQTEGDYGNPDPQTTNIPYTAWVGTEIRLVKCFDIESDRLAAAQSFIDEGATGKFTIEAWSGDNTTRRQLAVLHERAWRSDVRRRGSELRAVHRSRGRNLRRQAKDLLLHAWRRAGAALLLGPPDLVLTGSGGRQARDQP